MGRSKKEIQSFPEDVKDDMGMALRDVVYVFHAFKKKSKKGVATPKSDTDLVKDRLKKAEEHYKKHFK